MTASDDSVRVAVGAFQELPRMRPEPGPRGCEKTSAIG